MNYVTDAILQLLHAHGYTYVNVIIHFQAANCDHADKRVIVLVLVLNIVK